MHTCWPFKYIRTHNCFPHACEIFIRFCIYLQTVVTRVGESILYCHTIVKKISKILKQWTIREGTITFAQYRSSLSKRSPWTFDRHTILLLVHMLAFQNNIFAQNNNPYDDSPRQCVWFSYIPLTCHWSTVPSGVTSFFTPLSSGMVQLRSYCYSQCIAT